ncbi:hypothetical protein [Reichenbachiella ulvae]|uniref:Uncharacterized protein n=1 Tax=Reichenbachiella ulvae TaxID=2980104 RepID=A0ABT3CTV7_9BACT|nr:hypothetical protein [Reichenbachiella ulvae]MCV9387140.1 hypothetical protein [Reichenbachiella ulvae]
MTSHKVHSWSIVLSLLLSLIGIIFIIIGQYKLGLAYQYADGKTQALYGVKVFLMGSQWLWFGLFALIFSVISMIRKEKRIHILISLILALIEIILPFSNLWKFWA